MNNNITSADFLSHTLDVLHVGDEVTRPRFYNKWVIDLDIIVYI